MKTIPLSLDGFTDLPPGKVASIVTHLERTVPPAGDAPAAPAGLVVRHIPAPDPRWYRALFRRIGEDWLWSSLTIMPDDQLAALLADPGIEILVLERAGEAIGIAELDWRQPGEVEIVLLGVVAAAIGTGAAHYLMEVVLRHAFRPDIGRVWLHTCTFDHQGAVRFYRRADFTPFRIAIEVSDDPRLTGHLPETAAPHVALIRPKG